VDVDGIPLRTNQNALPFGSSRFAALDAALSRIAPIHTMINDMPPLANIDGRRRHALDRGLKLNNSGPLKLS
jgi:hypothetical protein